MSEFFYKNPYPVLKDSTDYRLLTNDYVSEEEVGGRKILKVDPKALELLAKEAFVDVSFLLRASHLEKVSKILDDPEASENDRYVALTLLKNAVIAAEGSLPSCQDTGTAIVFAKKGESVWTGGNDAESLSRGIFNTYQEKNLRYSQMAPLSIFEEKNTGCNLPAQIDIHATSGDEYEFLFLAKGGGSANKTFLYQMTKSLLNEKSLSDFVSKKLFDFGTAACPPYHVAIVIGGTSAEANLKAVKLASAGYYDELPTEGNEFGQAFRDLEWERKVLDLAAKSQIGAQFGGKYLAHDIRVIRLPRHAASCPVGFGVSCSADRNIKGKITKDGVFLEQLEKNPGRFLPNEERIESEKPIEIDLDKPMEDILKELSNYPIKTRLSLSGTLIVARDVAHARIQEMLDAGKPMPDYFKNHPIYYAGPAKTPEGMVTGSFGPTTAGRMDVYVPSFMKERGSMVMLAKGNRSQQVTDACKEHGGFYLGSIGGPAAILAKENILDVEIVDFEELGMEAIRKIKVKNFPAFIVCDDKGNDFFSEFKRIKILGLKIKMTEVQKKTSISKSVNQYWPSMLCLLIANFLPIIMIFFGWSVFDVMFLYWLENVIIGVINIFKICIVGNFMSIIIAPFFTFHYGMFCSGHLVFVIALFGEKPYGYKGFFPPAHIMWNYIDGVKFAALLLLASHLFSFIYNYLMRQEYKYMNVHNQMHAPYGRIIILHITIIVGGFLVMALGKPIVGIILLVALKILSDLFFHIGERTKAQKLAKNKNTK